MVVNSFLIVYERASGRVEVRDFGMDRESALKARFEAEVLAGPDTEVVVLGATSRETLERTHARYFRTVGELARAGAQLEILSEGERSA